MIQVTDSFADMLAMITRSFLSGSEEELQQMPSIKASDRYRSVLASLAKNLKEAKYEHYVMGTEREYEVEARLVNCMQRLAQGIGGLRSAASTQFSLLAQSPPAGAVTPINADFSPFKLNASPSLFPPYLISPKKSTGCYLRLMKLRKKRNTEDTANSVRESSVDGNDNLPTVHLPAEIFSRFIMYLGPSLVCETCRTGYRCKANWF
jgi:hypothetical protein